MDGVITAIVAFIFTCIIFPSLVKNRHQYYAALLLVLLAIFAEGLSGFEDHGGFRVFMKMAVAMMAIGAILLLILSAGGLAMRDLAADIGKTIEVVRRGGEKETIIVPLGQRPLSEDEKVYVPRKRDSADGSEGLEP